MVVVVLGSTGYTGELLLRLLDSHPHVERVYAVSQSQSGSVRNAKAPRLGFSEKVCGYVAPSELPRLKADLLFSALPHLQSTSVWECVVGKMLVIDLAADHRISDAKVFEAYYGAPPPVLSGARVAYGIPELYREQIIGADVIANPGCFPTAGLIPLVPLVRDGLLVGDIIVNAITGISGAGKSRDPNYLFSARTENSGAYKPGSRHRHWAEFQQHLVGHRVQFVPHLAPLSRGIAATISCRLRSGVSEKDIIYAYAQAYPSSPFVRYVGQRHSGESGAQDGGTQGGGSTGADGGNDNAHGNANGEGGGAGANDGNGGRVIPQTADVRGSNRCDFSWQLEDDGRLLLFSVIDNLMKGASGQAVQNMNVRVGFAEDAGLPHNAEL